MGGVQTKWSISLFFLIMSVDYSNLSIPFFVIYNKNASSFLVEKIYFLPTDYWDTYTFGPKLLILWYFAHQLSPLYTLYPLLLIWMKIDIPVQWNDDFTLTKYVIKNLWE